MGLRDPGTRHEAAHRVTTERHDDGRVEHVELASKVRLARCDLVCFGIAVVGWTALHDVRDEHVLAAPADRSEQADQQIAGTADERASLAVLVETRTLTDENDLGRGITFTGHGLRAGLVETTPGARPYLAGDDLERRLALGPCHAVPPPAGSGTGPR